MQALILSDDARVHHELSLPLTRRGFHIVHSESVMMATAHVRAWAFDLILMSETVGGQLSHRVALSAEKRAPFVKTLMMTNRTGADVEELYDLLPSLVSLVSPDLSPELTGQIAAACVTGSARSLDVTVPDGPAPIFASIRGTLQGEQEALAS